MEEKYVYVIYGPGEEIFVNYKKVWFETNN